MEEKPVEIMEHEVRMEFVRASGPGGQNVNKVSTAVHLMFDAERSPSLPEPVRRRLIRLAGKRVDSQGILHIQAASFRTQNLNRQDAMTRLNDLVRKAWIVPKKRIRTKPTAASKERKLLSKRLTGAVKRLRKPVRDSDE